MISPFIDADHFIQNYFPPREYAITIPIVVGVLGLVAVVGFLSLIMIKSRRKSD
jgi:dolichol phosphate-mannose biosynthesis regulatory protein